MEIFHKTATKRFENLLKLKLKAIQKCQDIGNLRKSGIAVEGSNNDIEDIDYEKLDVADS